MGWCNDINSKYYNKEIITNTKSKHEKLFRKDRKYDYLIVVKYNYTNTIKGKGISDIENDMFAWHHRAPNEDEYKTFIKEIDEK